MQATKRLVSLLALGGREGLSPSYHAKNHSVSLCPCLTATTADRFYRIDRAQVSAASSSAIVPLNIYWEGTWVSCVHMDQQAGSALDTPMSHISALPWGISGGVAWWAWLTTSPCTSRFLWKREVV